MKKRSVWLPLLLLIYGLGITVLFADDWIASGHTLRLWLTVAADIVIVAALWFFLRKKERF